LSGYTVKQVAKLSGVSVRTLHHYDEIGLLKPDSVGANGYRYYGRMSSCACSRSSSTGSSASRWTEIRQVLDAPDFDRVAALKAHRARMEAETRRYRQLVKTIDTTLAALQGATTMDDKQMYRGFDPKKQAAREAELVERFGEKVRPTIEHARKVVANTTQADFDARQAEFTQIEDAMAKALKDGAPPDSGEVQAQVQRLHTWVGGWWGEAPTRARFIGLAGFYVEHPEFRARYEAKAAGLSEYLQAAMRAFAERELA
jgi:DNA-binding transcriptional MerR regulator